VGLVLGSFLPLRHVSNTERDRDGEMGMGRGSEIGEEKMWWNISVGGRMGKYHAINRVDSLVGRWVLALGTNTIPA
jgi:hypothetical protein